MINGMNWDYFPIGTNYSYSLWTQSDETIKAALDAEMFCIEDIINGKMASIAGNTQETINANLDGIYQRLEVLEDGLKKLSHLGSENEWLRQKLETLEQQISLMDELPSEQQDELSEGITKATLSPLN